MHQQIYIFDSPDGTGKTEIAKELSFRTNIPYFKMTTEHENWRKGKFKEALQFDQTYLVEFLKQTGYSAIIDRAYPAEWVYSKVFKRETDERVLLDVDQKFANLGATIIMPLKHDYSNSREDEVVPQEKLVELHSTYRDFSEWTNCGVVELYVDTFEFNLDKEIDAIFRAMKMFSQYAVVTMGEDGGNINRR